MTWPEGRTKAEGRCWGLEGMVLRVTIPPAWLVGKRMLPPAGARPVAALPGMAWEAWLLLVLVTPPAAEPGAESRNSLPSHQGAYDLVPKGAHARGYALQLKIKHC